MYSGKEQEEEKLGCWKGEEKGRIFAGWPGRAVEKVRKDLQQVTVVRKREINVGTGVMGRGKEQNGEVE